LEQLLPPASASFDILKEESQSCRNDYLRDLVSGQNNTLRAFENLKISGRNFCQKLATSLKKHTS